MPLRTLATYTVIDDGERSRQLGFRNFYEGDGTQYVQLRHGGSDQITMSIDDFRKLILAGEQLAELMANGENGNDSTETTA